ncbi:MAG: DUF885 family protein [Alphaproteobacteria bacterium]|nr:DUF885 family protein [Alphaproteobacteria bacterium]
MRHLISVLAITVAAVALSSCDSPPTQTETERFNTFLDERFDAWVSRSPTWQSYLGIKDDYDKWDDHSPERLDENLDFARKTIADIDAFDFAALDHQAQLSYRLYKDDMENILEAERYRYYGYQVNQMFGAQSDVPAFLINIHRVDTVEDAEAYVARLNGIPQNFGYTMDFMRKGQEMGILPPKFVFAHVLRDIDNVLTGRPYDNSDEDTALLADFRKKVGELEIADDEKAGLIARAEQALLESVAPAYAALKKLVLEQQALANTDDGAWKHPDGDDYYRYQLQEITTTDLTADEIHDLGLAEVARIHDEMRGIMAQVEFEGDLQAFFTFMREDDQFFYPNTEEGRDAYLQKTDTLIADMKTRLDGAFATLPKADLLVKPVEAFREQSAGKAFYQSPSPDGTRPGTYYVNLYDMADMAVYELDALAYHEAIPGHHMQIAIAQELEGIPKFRRYGGYTAYIEGWGLYSEYLPKEMGLYQDPYADFGRLSMELWRACRLVVDTGLHDKRWTREQAIQYLQDNTPAPEAESVKSIERYIVMPGQATAYKIGMLKILELRSEAEEALGDAFDIRAFHDVVLASGALPLDILESQVRDWIAEANGS